EADTGKVLWEVATSGRHLSWSADGRRAVVSFNTAKKLIDPATGKVLLEAENPRESAFAALTPDGRVLTTGGHRRRHPPVGHGHGKGPRPAPSVCQLPQPAADFGRREVAGGGQPGRDGPGVGPGFPNGAGRPALRGRLRAGRRAGPPGRLERQPGRAH